MLVRGGEASRGGLKSASLLSGLAWPLRKMEKTGTGVWGEKALQGTGLGFDRIHFEMLRRHLVRVQGRGRGRTTLSWGTARCSLKGLDAGIPGGIS